jgi:hypothetical protein
VLGEGPTDVKNDLARGKTLYKYPVVVDVPCGVCEQSFAEGGGNLIQELVFEPCRDVEDGNFLNGVRRILREATCRKFVIDGLKWNWLRGKTRHDIGSMMGRAGMIFYREIKLGKSESPTRKATLGIRYVHYPA